MDLELRRPVLEVWFDTEGPAAAMVDRDGACVPILSGLELPRVVVPHGHRYRNQMRVGVPFPDPRVIAAAGVAVEWRDGLAEQVPAAELVEIDTSNLNYTLAADGRFSEVRVGLARVDGGIAWFDYGHPPSTQAPRVAVATKVGILKQVLAEHPGCEGLDGGDLRFPNRWRDWLVPQLPSVDDR